MLIKIRGSCNGEHVHTSVFCGKEKGSLANCGTLCLKEEEYKAFCGTLVKGSYLPSNKVSIEIEGYLSKVEPLDDYQDP